MILDILNQVAATKSRKEKEEILRGHKYNTVLREVIFTTYDPSMVLYITQVDTDVAESISFEPITLEKAIYSLVSKVAMRELTGSKAATHIKTLWAGLNESDREVFVRVVRGDLKCGAGVGTFNKVWPNLIYDPPYQRCSSFSMKNLSNIKVPCISQTKEDGAYTNIIINDGIIYESRNGNTFNISLSESTEKTLSDNYDNNVLMGEIMALDEDGNTMPRQEANGYIESSEVDSSRIYFVLWDMVPYDDFINRKSSIPYVDRLTAVTDLCGVVNDDQLCIIDTVHCDTVEEVIAHFNSNVSKGLEGSVAKNLNGLWKHGTSKDQVKFKVVFEVELEVVGINEGSGRLDGMVGSLQCKSSCGKLEVGVGTGLKDAERKLDLWKAGDIITAKANDVLDTKEGITLFLPVFVCKRNDKDEADDLERIIEQKDSFVRLVADTIDV